MPILPQLKAMFNAQHNAPPMPADVPIAQLRQAIHAMIDQSFIALATPHVRLPVERDIAIPVDGGEITLRLYRGDAGDAVVPCHVYYHGGGFFLGTLDQGDTNCRKLAAALGCAVVSVDYRLAPEHRFPVAVDDSYAALGWVAAHAGELRIDPTRISVGGGSAGGNLAAVVAQLARDRGGPPIVAQVLEIPVTDFTSTQALTFADGIQIASEKAYAPLYLRDADDARDPRASPLLAETLAGLPPALVACAEYDQLQPEGQAYAERLAASGVPTLYGCWDGQFHGSQGFDRVIPDEAAAYADAIVDFLRKSYAAPTSR
ncbi:alpha/beta hydrolase [uncultured Sphingomonas sp.]|uniref:alpha/beta hydrolase n=1 Tax=uncultured Sphingomonas sp. TaxID=158754 RepID=UPI00260AFD93|nr:alpha/beta hydrolase [uncultured Sphingomonas sp.]